MYIFTQAQIYTHIHMHTHARKIIYISCVHECACVYVSTRILHCQDFGVFFIKHCWDAQHCWDSLLGLCSEASWHAPLHFHQIWCKCLTVLNIVIKCAKDSFLITQPFILHVRKKMHTDFISKVVYLFFIKPQQIVHPLFTIVSCFCVHLLFQHTPQLGLLPADVSVCAFEKINIVGPFTNYYYHYFVP